MACFGRCRRGRDRCRVFPQLESWLFANGALRARAFFGSPKRLEERSITSGELIQRSTAATRARNKDTPCRQQGKSDPPRPVAARPGLKAQQDAQQHGSSTGMAAMRPGLDPVPGGRWARLVCVRAICIGLDGCKGSIHYPCLSKQRCKPTWPLKRPLCCRVDCWRGKGGEILKRGRASV